VQRHDALGTRDDEDLPDGRGVDSERDVGHATILTATFGRRWAPLENADDGLVRPAGEERLVKRRVANPAKLGPASLAQAKRRLRWLVCGEQKEAP
jgi:hypothetical protein